jgi:hypothetical protein
VNLPPVVGIDPDATEGLGEGAMPEQAIEVLDASERTASRVETVGEAADPSFERRAALTGATVPIIP